MVLCCFCRLGRVTAELFGLWLQILRRAPRAVLWLYKHPRTAALRLQAHAERAGIAGARPLRMRACSVVASPPRPRGCPAGRGARRGSARVRGVEIQRTQERLSKHGPRAADRVLFAPPCQPKLAHLRRLSLADLALDTLDYNGTVTAMFHRVNHAHNRRPCSGSSQGAGASRQTTSGPPPAGGGPEVDLKLTYQGTRRPPTRSGLACRS